MIVINVIQCISQYKQRLKKLKSMSILWIKKKIKKCITSIAPSKKQKKEYQKDIKECDDEDMMDGQTKQNQQLKNNDLNQILFLGLLVVFFITMAFKFQLDVAQIYKEEQREKVFNLNNMKQSQVTKLRRVTQEMSKMKRQQGVHAQFPNYNREYVVPNLNKLIYDVNINVFTPAPPKARNESQKAIYRMVKKYSTRYESIFILIAQAQHKATKPFSQIYEQQKLSNINQNLQNMLLPQDFQKVKLFTDHGLDVKIVADQYSFNNFISQKVKEFQDHPKILDIYVEYSEKLGRTLLTTKKIKYVSDLCKFVSQQLKQQNDKCRKDIPYFNFIHSNSGPELYNRRTIIKSCLSLKSQQQLLQNNDLFVQKLNSHTAEMRDKQMKQVRKKKDFQIAIQTKKVNQKYNRWSDINKVFQEKFQIYLKDSPSLQQCSEEMKKAKKEEMYCWVISQYCMESAIYSIINNTIRYSLNTEKAKPISSFVKYLYDALRFYFTTRYKQANEQFVYRGARVSLVEQRSFIPKRYLWNLGFLSTSLNQIKAKEFLTKINEPDERVFIQIQISKLANQFSYLWDQQGFFVLQRIAQLQKYLLNQKQVLFNPLNVFQIQKWDYDNKILYLTYAPQLQILEKKKRGEQLTDSQKDLIRSINKLKDKDFDKGQQLLEEGNPNQAIKYYEQSNETGSTLSFSQKANYIKGLMQVGNLQKMQNLLKETIEQQVNAEKKLEKSQMSVKLNLENQVQSLIIYQQNSDFQIADEKAQQAKQRTIQKSKQFPSHQTLLLEIKTYIELAKIKISMNETLQSIQSSLQSLKIIDQMANVNFCYRLFEVGQRLKQIDGLKNYQGGNDDDHLKAILKEDNMYQNKYVDKLRDDTLRKIEKIRKFKIHQQQLQQPIQASHSVKSEIRLSTSNKNSSSKEDHKKAQQQLKKYFLRRAKRSQLQIFEQHFVYAYWKLNSLQIKSNKIENKKQIQGRQKLKSCLQSLLDIKNDYKQLFETQCEAYEVLYRNIYKTSINVKACLSSYHKNFYNRYEDFIRTEQKYDKYDQNLLDVASVLWRYGEILLEYGQIIQKPQIKEKEKDKDKVQFTESPSQKLGNEKIREAERIIREIQKRQNTNKKSYTYQKSQINRIRSFYLKSKTIDKEQSRKLAIIQQQDSIARSILSLDGRQKSNMFEQLMKTIDQNRELHEEDQNLNQTLFKIKDTCQKIQIINQSSNVQVFHQSYVQRLQSCQGEFNNVLSTILKYNQKQRMERNINMAQLYLIMAQNQFRLGLIQNSKNYLAQSNQCLEKALKIFQQKSMNKKRKKLKQQIYLSKYLLGNNIAIGCLRLESRIVGFFGKKEEKIKLMQFLKSAKITMFQKMNQPLNQADINQSIGILASNLFLLHKQIKFQQVQQPLEQSIDIRQKLLGPYNKYNARDYTLLVQMMCMPEIYKQHKKQIDFYFQHAQQIYNQVNQSIDSNIILDKMQLQSTYYKYTAQEKQACKSIILYLKLFDQCPNKQLTLQINQQLFKQAQFLTQSRKYRKQGLSQLKKSYAYASNLQQFILKNYNIKKSDKKNKKLNDLKINILKSIITVQQNMRGKQLEKYQDLLMEQTKLIGYQVQEQ